MQGGDLSNELPPRWLIVFEGVVGKHAGDYDRKAYEFYRRAHAWRRMVDTFHVDNHSVKMLWDLTWRQAYKFDVVTFLPGRCTEWVEEWLARYTVPAANVFRFSGPAELGQQLAYMPDVFAVVHGDPAHRFTYGNRGLLAAEGWTI